MDSIIEGRKRNEEWRQTVKVGDEAFIHSRHGYTFVKVTRLTPTQIIVGENMRFNKKTGDRCGQDCWNFESLVQPTEEIKQGIRERNERRKAVDKYDALVRKNSTNYTTEQLLAVVAILEPKPTFETNPDGSPVLVNVDKSQEVVPQS